ncbi:MAG: redoxin domain-containing protein [Betaproteobacteria bacterium]|nr:redoxin domain-containing protein [Betaproteobacteria bacterium]
MRELAMAPGWQASQWFNTEQPLSLAQLRGKVVLLHAFQMLCPGCVSHGVPQAERVHRQYATEGVAVVGLHTVFEHHGAMTPVALEAFLHEYRVTHPVGVDMAVAGDPIPATMRRYGMQGTPTLILIDPAGRLRLQEFGRIDDLHLGVLIGRLLMVDRVLLETSQPTDHSGDRSDGCEEQGCAVR